MLFDNEIYEFSKTLPISYEDTRDFLMLGLTQEEIRIICSWEFIPSPFAMAELLSISKVKNEDAKTLISSFSKINEALKEQKKRFKNYPCWNKNNITAF